MKYALLLIFLISCAPIAQEATTKPVVEQKIEAPKTEPVLEPQIKAPQEAPVQEKAPEPAKTQLTPQQECMQTCEENCAESAQNACTQKGRPECKAGCGETIDPSACTQACTYVPNQPNACKQMLDNFCSAQCVKVCH